MIVLGNPAWANFSWISFAFSLFGKTPISIFGSNTNVKNVAEEIYNSFDQKKITPKCHSSL